MTFKFNPLRIPNRWFEGDDPTASAPSGAEDQVSDAPPAQEADPTLPSQEEVGDTELKKTKKEAQTLRARLRELEKAQEAADRAKLSESEKLAADLKAALERANASETGLRAERIRNAVLRTASAQGLDPELAESLVKPEQLEFDESGSPTNVDKVLKALLVKWPHLKAGSAPTPPTTNPTNPARRDGRNALTLEAVRNMTTEQIQARWDEVQEVLKTGK
jgi:hypothetical protein